MRRWWEWAAPALVLAVFGGFWVVTTVWGEPPPTAEGYYLSLFWMAVFAMPGAIAARLLARAWSRANESRLSTLDGPARVLTAAVATLPAERAPWGAAMTAELAQVHGFGARWWFAAGGARTALFPPSGRALPIVPVGAIGAAAVVVAGAAVWLTLPTMGVFAVTFVALVCALAVLTVARAARIRPPASLAVAGLIAVLACVGALGYVLAHDPPCSATTPWCHPATSIADALPPATAIYLASMLAGCLWLVLNPPRALTTSRLARLVAIAALGGVVFADARAGTEGVMSTLFLGVIPILFVGPLVVAAVRRSFSVGLQTAVWTSILGALAVFTIGLIEALRWYQMKGTLIVDNDGGFAFGVNLTDFIVFLLMLPLWWLPFGLAGAAIGSRARPARG